MEKLPDRAVISPTRPPRSVGSNLPDLPPDLAAPKQERKRESRGLVSAALLALNPGGSEEVQRTKAESTRKEDEGKEEGRGREECEAGLREHAELLGEIGRLHGRLTEFAAGGSQACKQASNLRSQRQRVCPEGDPPEQFWNFVG